MFLSMSELAIDSEIIYFDGSTYNKGIIDSINIEEHIIHFVDGKSIHHEYKDIQYWVVKQNHVDKFGVDVVVGEDIYYKGHWYHVSELSYTLQEYGIIEAKVSSEKKIIIYFDIKYPTRSSR